MARENDRDRLDGVARAAGGAMHETILMTALVAAIRSVLPFAALLAALAIILSCAAHAQTRFRRSLAAAADSLTCPACGSHLGDRAVRAAEEARRERLAGFPRAFPSHKLPRSPPGRRLPGLRRGARVSKRRRDVSSGRERPRDFGGADG